MALVLDATVGGANSNSYITVAEADSYFEGMLHTNVWTGMTTAEKVASLVWATRLIDNLFIWYGAKETLEQKLDFPRVGIVSRDNAVTIGYDYVVGDFILPEELKNAVCELAILLKSTDRTLESDTKGIKSLGVGSIKLQFEGKEAPEEIPKSIENMLSNLGVLQNSGKCGTANIIRV